MNKSTKTSVFSPLKTEIKRQKKEREDRRRAKAIQGSFGKRLATGIKVWTIRLLYTAIMIMCVYLLVLCGTMLAPSIMAYILGGLGYTLGNVTEIFLASLGGLFLIGWMLAITMFLCKKALNIYIRGIKNTMSK